jgi:WD40 repeat protein
MDSSLRIFNVHPETGLTLYKEILSNKSFDIWKIDFNPNGNEILTGTLNLQTYDISTG